MQTYRVVAIPGDGIGPELLDAALAVLDAVVRRQGDFRIEAGGSRRVLDTTGRSGATSPTRRSRHAGRPTEC